MSIAPKEGRTNAVTDNADYDAVVVGAGFGGLYMLHKLRDELALKVCIFDRAGDSAGGGLCTTVLLSMRDQALALPAAGMPMSPWYDMELAGQSIRTNAAKDELVQAGILQSMAGLFLGDASPQHPLANLLYSVLEGLPPLYIQVGGDETLLDDSVRFAALANKVELEIKLDVFPEMQHVFHFLAGAAPEADEAINKIAEWVRPKLQL